MGGLLDPPQSGALVQPDQQRGEHDEGAHKGYDDVDGDDHPEAVEQRKAIESPSLRPSSARASPNAAQQLSTGGNSFRTTESQIGTRRGRFVASNFEVVVVPMPLFAFGWGQHAVASRSQRLHVGPPLSRRS